MRTAGGCCSTRQQTSYGVCRVPPSAALRRRKSAAWARAPPALSDKDDAAGRQGASVARRSAAQSAREGAGLSTSAVGPSKHLRGRACYEVGGLLFATKEPVQSHFRGILRSKGSVPFKLSDADAAQVVALLQHHPHAAAKVRGGVAAVHVRQRPDVHGDRCFWIVRGDSSETDVSFVKVRAGKGTLARGAPLTAVRKTGKEGPKACCALNPCLLQACPVTRAATHKRTTHSATLPHAPAARSQDCVRDLSGLLVDTAPRPPAALLTMRRAATICPGLTSPEAGTQQCTISVPCPPGYQPIACGCRVAQRGDDAFWVIYAQQWADKDEAGRPACHCWWTNTGRVREARFHGLVDATCALTEGMAAAAAAAGPSDGDPALTGLEPTPAPMPLKH